MRWVFTGSFVTNDMIEITFSAIKNLTRMQRKRRLPFVVMCVYRMIIKQQRLAKMYAPLSPDVLNCTCNVLARDGLMYNTYH